MINKMTQITKQQASIFTRSSVNILVHVIILFTFLSAFFFFYVSQIESDAFKSEVGVFIEKGINDMLDKDPQMLDKIEALKPTITKLMKLYDKPMRSTVEHNINIKLMATFSLLILFGILLTIVLTVTFECHKNVSIGHILIENVIIFICIGIVEYMFFTKVAVKYIPVSPSIMVNTMFSTAKSTLANTNQ